MIQTQTTLSIVDNSGVKGVKCIKTVGSKKRYAVVGSLVQCSIQELRYKKNKKIGFNKGGLVLGVVAQTRARLVRKDGQTLRFFNNSVVLVDKQRKPLSTRVLTPLCSELRGGSTKLLSLAQSVL
jgi:large subunit ribosomal protein L14